MPLSKNLSPAILPARTAPGTKQTWLRFPLPSPPDLPRGAVKTLGHVICLRVYTLEGILSEAN